MVTRRAVFLVGAMDRRDVGAMDRRDELLEKPRAESGTGPLLAIWASRKVA